MDNQEILDRIDIVDRRLCDNCYQYDTKFDEIYCKIQHLEYVDEALTDCIKKIEAAMPRVIELLQEESIPIDLSALEQIM